MKKYILFWLLLIAVSLYADIHSAAGTYGYKFLNIPVHPVSVALGGRGVHNTANNLAWLSQPAVSCIELGKSAGAAQVNWIGDTSLSSAYYSNSNRSNHIGFAFRNLNYGEIEKRDDTGFLIGNYNPVDISVMGNYSSRLGAAFYLGINLGVMYQKLDTASSLGVNSDIGVSILPPIEESKVSLSLRNFGSATKTKDQSELLPYSFELDFFKAFDVMNQKLEIEVSGIKSADSDLRMVLGAELKLMQHLALRTGYKFNYDAENLTAGLGISISRFQIDYGYAAFNEGLMDVHSFGIRYNF